MAESDPDNSSRCGVFPFGKNGRFRPPLFGMVGLIIFLLCFGVFFPSCKNGNPNVGTIGKDNRFTVSDNFGEMVLIFGGKFKLSRANEGRDENSKHEAEVKDFFLDKYEVTNQQYRKCVEAGKCRTPANWSGETYAQEQASMPVTHVTWADALTYAQFAGKRLPTEVEWEYVACGGKKCLNYPWGDDWEANAANVSSGALAPAPVGSFAKDQTLGIFDIVGNVSEWVQYDNSAYGSQEPIRDCLNCKIYRGGNFKDKISDSPVTKRWEVTPDIPSDQADQIFPKVGFRCAKNVPANMNLVPKKTRLYMLIISKASTSLDRLTSLYPSQSRRVNSDSIYHIHIDHLSTDNLTRQKIALKE